MAILMRLYLSSFKIGNRADLLQRLVDGGRRAAVIMNALDSSTEASRAKWLSSQRQAMGDLGFEAEEVDLRSYFQRPEEMADLLRRFDLIWVNGGNTFVLRRAMARSGFDDAIRMLLAQNQVAYGGFSAGSMVLSPTLRGAELVDDPHVVPPGYDREVIWDGLGVVKFQIAPHYRSEHSESEAIEREVAFYEDQGLDYIAIRDGQAIVVSGDDIEIVG